MALHERLFHRFLHGYVELRPEQATVLGVHDNDSRLNDNSAGALALSEVPRLDTGRAGSAQTRRAESQSGSRLEITRTRYQGSAARAQAACATTN